MEITKSEFFECITLAWEMGKLSTKKTSKESELWNVKKNLIKKIEKKRVKPKEYKNYEAECENCQHTFIIIKDKLTETPYNEFRSALSCPVCDSSVFTLEKVERKKQLEIENKSILNYTKKR